MLFRSLLAFAGNSILCRWALGETSIGEASFTVIRLLSAAVALGVILCVMSRGAKTPSKGSWKAAIFLVLYAVAFSYAYVSLETGVGALILFGAVQFAMIFSGIMSGNKLHATEWAGVCVAFLGFVYLVLPNLTLPSFSGFLLMAIAGVSWAGYTLAGKRSQFPLADTAFNFFRTLPFAALLFLLTVQSEFLTSKGVILAIVSGALTSGLGYALWYRALAGLSSVQAAVVQLLVPVLAILGGVVVSNEAITMRLVVSLVLVLGGILVVIMGKRYVDKIAARSPGH